MCGEVGRLPKRMVEGVSPRGSATSMEEGSTLIWIWSNTDWWPCSDITSQHEGDLMELTGVSSGGGPMDTLIIMLLPFLAPCMGLAPPLSKR